MAMGQHLTKRKKSQHWQLEIRFPEDFEFDHLTFAMFEGKRHFIKSMGTPNRAEAEYRAADLIHSFRISVYRWRQFKRQAEGALPVQPLRYSRSRQYLDGLQKIDGQDAVVVGPVVTFYGSDGQPNRVEENPPKWLTHAPLVEDAATAASVLHFDPDAELPPKFKPHRVNGDDGLIESYIVGKKLRDHVAKDARSTWSLYKERIGKPLARATRKDGKELARIIAETGAARATVQKKIGWLAAAVNYATSEDKFSGPNPFVNVLGDDSGRPAEKRSPLTEEHMELCWRNLARLSPSDQLLWKFLAKTGARLGEAVTITRDFQERGTSHRFVTIGTKTSASLRNVPVPPGIGMPKPIVGELFPGGASAASKRLNRFIKASLPNWTPDLVVHSLRHRAIDVFRLTGKGDPYIRRRLVGHAATDVHDSYGAAGPPIRTLLTLINANPIDGSLRLDEGAD